MISPFHENKTLAKMSEFREVLQAFGNGMGESLEIPILKLAVCLQNINVSSLNGQLSVD